MAERSNSGRTRLTAAGSQRGHEGPFVQPASYLLRPPRVRSLPMNLPEKAIDREERHGLVSLWFARSCFALSSLSFPPLFPRQCPSRARPSQNSAIPSLARWFCAFFCLTQSHSLLLESRLMTLVRCSVPFATSSRPGTATMSSRSVFVSSFSIRHCLSRRV